ncbi:hypothetical protein CANTEDRAFT_116359, partial [Yamadazyma tenuis ATCC 10573]
MTEANPLSLANEAHLNEKVVAAKSIETNHANNSNSKTEFGPLNTDFQADSQKDSSKNHQSSKDEMIQEILQLKASISHLVGNVRDIKMLCEKSENDNQYLQEYVGTLMKTN